MTTRTIATLGLTAHDRALLQTAVSLVSEVEANRWMYVEDMRAAQVIIINADTPAGQNALKHYDGLNSATGPLVVIYSAHSKETGPYTHVITSPLTYVNISALLRTLEIEWNSLRKQTSFSTPASLVSSSRDTPGASVESPALPEKVDEPAESNVERNLWGSIWQRLRGWARTGHKRNESSYL